MLAGRPPSPSPSTSRSCGPRSVAACGARAPSVAAARAEERRRRGDRRKEGVWGGEKREKYRVFRSVGGVKRYHRRRCRLLLLRSVLARDSSAPGGARRGLSLAPESQSPAEDTVRRVASPAPRECGRAGGRGAGSLPAYPGAGMGEGLIMHIFRCIHKHR